MRGDLFGALLREEIVEEVGHCPWTFTVPKLLRPFFLHRRRSAAQAPVRGELACNTSSPANGLSRAQRRRLRRGWAQLIRRIYEADPLLCTCGEQMRILSFLTEPPVVRRILAHLERSGSEASRAPPRPELEPQALAS